MSADLYTTHSWSNPAQDSDIFLSDGTHNGRQLLSKRVVGVGIGVFLFFFFLALSLVICLFGSRTKSPWTAYIVSSFMFLIVALVLVASPKGEKQVKPETGYDQTIIPLVIIAALLVLGILTGGIGLIIFHVVPPLYARPVSYHLDVERKH